MMWVIFHFIECQAIIKTYIPDFPNFEFKFNKDSSVVQTSMAFPKIFCYKWKPEPFNWIWNIHISFGSGLLTKTFLLGLKFFYNVGLSIKNNSNHKENEFNAHSVSFVPKDLASVDPNAVDFKHWSWMKLPLVTFIRIKLLLKYTKTVWNKD